MRSQKTKESLNQLKDYIGGEMQVKGKNITFVANDKIEYFLDELAYRKRMSKSEYLRTLIKREAINEKIEEE